MSANDRFSSIEPLFSNFRSRIFRADCEGKTFLLKTVAEDSAVLWKMLRREWELSMNISHPDIVHVYAFEKDTPIGDCIVMEYVDGRTLREFLEEKPSRALKKRVLTQLLDALAYLHSKGVVHNDIKPDNILVTRADNDLKLIDLGLADDDIHSGMKACGFSRYYCSPELLEAALGGKVTGVGGKSAPDCRSDIFSVGCIIRDIFPQRYPLIVRKCLKTDPDTRYCNIDALKSAIARRNALPYITAVIAICAILSGIILRQNTTIADLRSTIGAIEDENRAMKADEQATVDLKAAIFEAIDIRLSELVQSAKSSLQQKDKNEAFVEFHNEFSAFCNELQKETPPEMWEEIRRYLVEERLKLSDELFK